MTATENLHHVVAGADEIRAGLVLHPVRAPWPGQHHHLLVVPSLHPDGRGMGAHALPERHALPAPHRSPRPRPAVPRKGPPTLASAHAPSVCTMAPHIAISNSGDPGPVGARTWPTATAVWAARWTASSAWPTPSANRRTVSPSTATARSSWTSVAVLAKGPSITSRRRCSASVGVTRSGPKPYAVSSERIHGVPGRRITLHKPVARLTDTWSGAHRIPRPSPAAAPPADKPGGLYRWQVVRDSCPVLFGPPSLPRLLYDLS